MTNTFDDVRGNDSQPRHAAEWGLASLLLGGILAVLALLTMQLNLQLFLSPPVWAAWDVRALYNAAVWGSVVLGGMGVASVAFGVRGLVSAYRRGQPSALGWAGLLVSILALLLWVGTLADLFMVVQVLTRRLGLPG